jgi:hypothetical protein
LTQIHSEFQSEDDAQALILPSNPHSSLIHILRFKKKKASNLAQGMSKTNKIMFIPTRLTQLHSEFQSEDDAQALSMATNPHTSLIHTLE